MSFDDVKIRTGVSWVANDLDERGETWLGLIATTNGKTKIEELNIKQEGGGGISFFLCCCCCCFFLYLAKSCFVLNLINLTILYG